MLTLAHVDDLVLTSSAVALQTEGPMAGESSNWAVTDTVRERGAFVPLRRLAVMCFICLRADVPLIVLTIAPAEGVLLTLSPAVSPTYVAVVGQSMSYLLMHSVPPT